MAGVSKSTVSRVLNRPELVDEVKRKNVRDAMDQLEFHPNAIARGLSIQKTHTIGLVIPGINDLFFTELYRGIERASRENGMKVLLFDSQHSKHRALDGFTFLQQHQVEGIIFTSKSIDEDYDPVLQRIGIPVVLALAESSAKTPLSAFKVDDVRAMFDAVAYLVARGHRRIGMISGEIENDAAGALRLQGYRAGLMHDHINFREDYVEGGNYRFDGGYMAMKRLLERQKENQLTAICAASDEMAIGAMRCLHDHGIHVPGDISIIGFDDLSIASMVTPSLTTIAQPFSSIGERVVETLLQIIRDDGDPPLSGTYYLPHQIVERESVAHIGF